MASTQRPNPHLSFTVSSGCLCFGELHNIWDGAGAPVQPFADHPPDPVMGGTVRVQPVQFNTVAKNGTWHAYKLVNTEGQRSVTGWFVAHEDVEPEIEVKKIIRISGAPGEVDSGSTFNDETTARNGVLVLNRYDWASYDTRSRDEAGEPVDEDNFEMTVAAGLVDRADARETVRVWREQRSSQRQATESGVWLDIPDAEYHYGRFGFDDEHTAARSFLLFTADTDFIRASFAGSTQPLRKDETLQERFERRLQEGWDFSGLDYLRKYSKPPFSSDEDRAVPASDCFGPYDASEHILREADIKAVIRQHLAPRTVEHNGRSYNVPSAAQGPVNEAVRPQFEVVQRSLYDLLNELIMSSLERFAGPGLRHRSPMDAADVLFARPDANALDKICHGEFTQQGDRPPAVTRMPDFDVDAVGARIKSFLERVGRPGDVFEDESVAGITRVAAYLVCEIIELAHKAACDLDFKITPRHVRMAVFNDSELLALFKFSKVFWYGRDWQ